MVLQLCLNKVVLFLKVVKCSVHVWKVTSVVSDSATLRTMAHQAPLSMGFSRQEYWSGLPWSPAGDLSYPGIESKSLTSPASAGKFFTVSAPGKPLNVLCWVLNNGYVGVKWSHSVVSDSLWPQGLQPTRLLCPWDSPGKNTGVGCPALLQRIFLTQRWNPCLLHLQLWQADSLLLSHLGWWGYIKPLKE